MIVVNANTKDFYVEFMGLQLTANQAQEFADRLTWAIWEVIKATDYQYSDKVDANTKPSRTQAQKDNGGRG